MTILDFLGGATGTWRATSVLKDPMNNVDEKSDSTMLVSSVLGGRFMRLDYVWSYQGKPQEGSLLVGLESKAEKASACWVDTWHMGHAMMLLTGPAAPGRKLSLLGSYAAPPGPDWGWRINLDPNEEQLGFTMFNIWPEGREELAVEALYRR
jgi:hypothetical protein